MKFIKFKILPTENFDDYIYMLVHQFFRLVPIKGKKGKLSVKIDGIVELNKYYFFIEAEYVLLLDKYYDIIKNIKCIRDKAEHEPHNILWTLMEGRRKSIKLYFKYKENETITIDIKDLSKLVKDLNIIITKVQKQTKEYISFDPSNLENKYMKIDFLEYNEKLEEIIGIDNV